jgi:N utilization substance protein A
MVYATKEIVATAEEVEDEVTQISMDDAKEISKKAVVGDTINVEIKSKEFGRIATQNAKNVILQKIREEERSVVYNQFFEKEKDVVTGIVQRYMGKNISINLGKADAVLNEAEQVKGEEFKPTEHIKVYILEVKNTPKGPRILVSRTHPELVKRLFEAEVTEIKDGTVEIMSIAREAGSRTKIAVRTNNPNVDAVGACVGMNGARVNAIVEELRGEKIDIVNWDENPGNFIQNALSPAKIVAVFADPDEKTAKVVVPDYQLSLAIGKEGQNARLAARLTGYKIDIKSETQAKDAEGFRYEDYMYDEDGDVYYEEEEEIVEDTENISEESEEETIEAGESEETLE